MRQDSAFKMYSIRWRSLPAAFAGGVFLVGCIAILLGGKAGGPVLVVVWTVVALCSAFVSLFGMYWVLTPVPLFRVDGSGLWYQDFPLVGQSVRWVDVDTVRAIKGRTLIRGAYSRRPQLTLYIDVTPQAVTPRGIRGGAIWHFSGADLPVPAEEVVRHIRLFHAVDYHDQYDQVR